MSENKEVPDVTWGNAIKSFLIALPEMVRLVKPTLDFLNALLFPDPAKKATELGDIARVYAESLKAKTTEEKEEKRYEALERFANFGRNN